MIEYWLSFLSILTQSNDQKTFTLRLAQIKLQYKKTLLNNTYRVQYQKTYRVQPDILKWITLYYSFELRLLNTDDKPQQSQTLVYSS